MGIPIHSKNNVPDIPESSPIRQPSLKTSALESLFHAEVEKERVFMSPTICQMYIACCKYDHNLNYARTREEIFSQILREGGNHSL